MAVRYRITPVKDNLSQEKSTRYIARSSARMTADLNMVSRKIAGSCTASPADVSLVLIAFTDVLTDLLCDNFNVHVPPLGVFSLSLKSESHETPEEVNHSSVKKLQLQFRPSKEIINRLKVAKLEKTT